MTQKGQEMEEGYTKSRGYTISIILTAMMAASVLLTILQDAGAQDISHAKEEIGSSSIKIEFKKGLLSASLKNADLAEVLDIISQQIGAKTKSYCPVEETITREFVNLTPEEGLKRLLRNQNYYFVYSDAGRKDGGSRNIDLLGILCSNKKGKGPVTLISEKEGTGNHTHYQDRNLTAKELSDDLITELISLTSGLQDEEINSFGEIIKNRLKEIGSTLWEVLEESGEKGEGVDREEIEGILKGLREKYKPGK